MKMFSSEQPIKKSNQPHWLKQFLLRIIPQRPRWETVAEGPANISGLRYKLERTEIKGTYIKQRNQYGEERYWITEPDGTSYMKGPESVIQDQQS